ncbi:uncharacterized protein LY89DRAFT_641602 [Mollisia scopiformis]|uniref:Copper acquisition factor BIM1-like domain-containing protein n=1 Tax=Mollisia scopiformis TaxID=149040 RepID=A0A194XIU8_MOLSC|nr:uncharacterized protein LY89DRAFT_641602 [Mollisia scopiformis]KUJ20088.1 hypothetical protein LY89DRAFT_641602 [Mollisia scopiformis]
MSQLVNLCIALIAALLLGQTSAQPSLNYPPSISDGAVLGLDYLPCGGNVPDYSSDNVTDFHVEGDAVALYSNYTQTIWQLGAFLDTGNGVNYSNPWTIVLPPINQSGVGDYCNPSVPLPGSFAGLKGVIMIIQLSMVTDGSVNQCAAVNFVPGRQTDLPSTCTNDTGVSATFAATWAQMSSAAAAVPGYAILGPPSSSAAMSSTHNIPAVIWLFWIGYILCLVACFAAFIDVGRFIRRLDDELPGSSVDIEKGFELRVEGFELRVDVFCGTMT